MNYEVWVLKLIFVGSLNKANERLKELVPEAVATTDNGGKEWSKKLDDERSDNGKLLSFKLFLFKCQYINLRNKFLIGLQIMLDRWHNYSVDKTTGGHW